MPETLITPVVIFAYNRPDLLNHTLDCLYKDSVPVIYAFSDGARTPEQADAVAQVRHLLRNIDWCEMHLIERQQNLGLGRSIVTGVTEVLNIHNRVIVYEDDLISVPGTYQYLCAALAHYQNQTNVMSVTGWTHPLITPKNVGNQAYLDGRAECLVWGTWARAWHGMEHTTAIELMQKCPDPYRYGEDLVEMAKTEKQRNLWAVRWLYWHMQYMGLCVRPPHSLVEHIGTDSRASNTATNDKWQNPPLRDCPAIPNIWPDAVEHQDCPKLWQMTNGYRPNFAKIIYRAVRQWAGKMRRNIGL